MPDTTLFKYEGWQRWGHNSSQAPPFGPLWFSLREILTDIDIRKTILLSALTAIFIAGLGTGRWAFQNHRADSMESQGIGLDAVDLRVQTTEKAVALTFDDGPSPRWTPAVLKILAQFKARGTFFLVGRNALANPRLVAQEVLAGDEIGNHTFDHPNLRALTAAGVDKELVRGARAIERAGAPKPTLFRPPWGFTDKAAQALAGRHSYRTIAWNLAVEHFVDHQSVNRGVSEIMARVSPGAIILAHDGRKANRTRTIEALPILLKDLRARGYRLVTVDELLRMGRPVSDQAGPLW